MVSKKLLFFMAVLAATVLSCSDDNEAKKKGDANVDHDGEKWTIASVEYLLVDQSVGTTIGQTVKSGTKENAGSFYFIPGGVKGSFEMNIEGYNKEDVFNYSIDELGEVSILDVEQNAGVVTNQNILALTGSSTETNMTLSGSITKQSTSGNFVLTINSISLVKN